MRVAKSQVEFACLTWSKMDALVRGAMRDATWRGIFRLRRIVSPELVTTSWLASPVRLPGGTIKR